MLQPKSHSETVRKLILKELAEVKKDHEELGKKKSELGWCDRKKISATVGVAGRMLTELINKNLVDACGSQVRISREGEAMMRDAESASISETLKVKEREGLVYIYERKLRDNYWEKERRQRVTDGAMSYPRDKFDEITFVHLLEKKLIRNCCDGHGVRDLIWLSEKGFQVAAYIKQRRDSRGKQ